MDRISDFLEQAIDIVMFVMCVSAMIGFSTTVIRVLEETMRHL